MIHPDTIRTSPHENDETAIVFPCGHAQPDSCERCDRGLIRRRGFLRGIIGATVAVIAAPVIVQVPPSFGRIVIDGQAWAFGENATMRIAGEVARVFTAEWAIAR